MPAPLSIRTGGRISSTLRPQCVVKPAFSARAATASIAACASSSSGTPRQCSAAIASLSSSRTRSLRAGGRRTPRGRTPARAASRPAARGRLSARSRPASAPPTHASRGRRSSRARRSGARRTRAGRTRRRPRRSGARPRSAAAACSRACARRRGAGRSAPARRRRPAARPSARARPSAAAAAPGAFPSGPALGLVCRPMPNDPIKGEGWAAASLDDLGEGPGFRKVRSALGVTAFGANAIVSRPATSLHGTTTSARRSCTSCSTARSSSSSATARRTRSATAGWRACRRRRCDGCGTRPRPTTRPTSASAAPAGTSGRDGVRPDDPEFAGR